MILTDPDSAGHVLVVNFSTYYPKTNQDETCILQPGDHAWVRHDTFVKYREAAWWNLDNIEKSCSIEVFQAQDPVSQEVLDRIRAGVMISPTIRRGVRRRYLQSTGL